MGVADEVWSLDEAEELFDAIHPIRWARQLQLLRFVYRQTAELTVFHDARVPITLGPDILEERGYGTGRHAMRALHDLVDHKVVDRIEKATGSRPGLYAIEWNWQSWSDRVPWAPWAIDQRGTVSRGTVGIRLLNPFAGQFDARLGAVDARFGARRSVQQSRFAGHAARAANVFGGGAGRAQSRASNVDAVQCSWRAKALLHDDDESSSPTSTAPPAAKPTNVTPTAAVLKFIDDWNHVRRRDGKPTVQFWGEPLEVLNACVTEENRASLVTFMRMNYERSPKLMAYRVRDEAQHLATPRPNPVPAPTPEQLEAMAQLDTAPLPKLSSDVQRSGIEAARAARAALKQRQKPNESDTIDAPQEATTT